MHGALYRSAARIDDAIAARADLGAIAVLEVDHPSRHRQDGGDIGRSEILAFAQSKQERRTAPRHDHRLGIARRNHRKGKGTLQLADGAHAGVEKRLRGLAVLGDEMGHDLGIRIRDEFIARALEPLADRFVVLDDAVVHHRQIAGEMRVCIALGGRAVRCPARVRDARLAADVLGARLRRELGDASGRTHALQAGAVHHRDARRVVAAILEAPQSLDQDRNDVAPRGGADDAAHRLSLSSSAVSRTGSTPGGRAPASAVPPACPW